MSIRKYSVNKRPRRRLFFLALIVLILLALGTGAYLLKNYYYNNLKPVSSSQKSQLVTISTGSSLSVIAKLLKDDGLIRNQLVFEEYVSKINERTQLQAGTYDFSPSQDVPSIVKILTSGRVATSLVKILPGRRIDQIKADLINAGFSPTAVDNSLDPSLYQDLPVMAYKPAGANLEGLLYPDSFQRNSDTDPSVIVRDSLTEMGKHLTPALKTAYANENLSVYQAITLSSIVEKEVSSASDRTQVAQVFLSRLKAGMKLESNVTANYGAILAGKSPSPAAVNIDSPYNTYLHNGLPPGPLCTIDDTALDAVASPANTNYLYFVTGKDGVTRFSQTIDGQNANIQQYGNADL